MSAGALPASLGCPASGNLEESASGLLVGYHEIPSVSMISKLGLRGAYLRWTKSRRRARRSQAGETIRVLYFIAMMEGPANSNTLKASTISCGLYGDNVSAIAPLSQTIP